MLRIAGASKTFGSTRALDGVDLELRRGEVHALLGQNGSGKSTLIKILSGYHPPDGGTLEIAGRRVHLPPTANELRANGVAVLHQDMGLVPDATVLENLNLGSFTTPLLGRVSWRRERREATTLFEEFHLDVALDAQVRSLSQTTRALLAIARAVREGRRSAGAASILILDEPTAYLNRDDAGRLFQAVRRATADGNAVLFVTHRLDEVLQLAARVSVLRDGRCVATRTTTGLAERDLIQLIIGRDLDELYPAHDAHPGKVVLTADGLSGAGITELSLDLRAGEILGITGLAGSGFEDVPYLLFGGVSATATGRVVYKDRDLTRIPTPREAVKAGIALLPADRAHQSGLPTATVAENVTMPRLGEYWRGGRLRKRREREDVDRLLDAYDIRPTSSAPRLLSTLSGGNQQKALLAKWLGQRPDVLLLHEPTNGVDVGSRQIIFQILADASAAGTGILIASGEHDELAHLCHRVIVLRNGRVVSTLTGGGLTADRIIERCMLA